MHNVVQNRGRALSLAFSMNGFQVKAKNGRFTAGSSRCRQNLKYENFTSSFGRLRQKIAAKGVPHVQQDFFLTQPIKLPFRELNKGRRQRYRRRQKTTGNLSNHDNGNKNVTNFHI